MNGKIDFVYLNEQDMIKAGVTDMPKCIAAMEDMFTLLYKGDYRMGGDDANEQYERLEIHDELLFDGAKIGVIFLPCNNSDELMIGLRRIRENPSRR